MTNPFQKAGLEEIDLSLFITNHTQLGIHADRLKRRLNNKSEIKYLTQHAFKERPKEKFLFSSPLQLQFETIYGKNQIFLQAKINPGIVTTEINNDKRIIPSASFS